MDASDWIALLALVVSLGTALYTYRFSKTQHQLTEMLIREKRMELEDAKRAVFKVEFERGRSSARLIIENVGTAPALDVFFFSDGPDDEFVQNAEANPHTHFPHNAINAGSKLSYPYIRHLGHTHSPSFTLKWHDKKGHHEKRFRPVLP
jgi:hypothetical protein